MASPRSEKISEGRLRLKAVRVAAVLLLLSVPCEGLSFPPRLPIHLRRTGGLGRQQVASREWVGRRKAAVSQATTPPHGDYDYAYGSNDGMDRAPYQQQGGGESGYTGNGYVTDDDPGTGAAAVAASVPAFDARAGITGTLTEEIQRRSVSVGQLFGRSAAAMGSKKQASGLEQSTPPGLLWRAGVKGMVPMAAAVGLSLTPSRYVAARAAGGVVLAIAANVARQAAVATRKRQAPQAMLELLRKEGAGDVTREQLVDLADKFFVKEPELWASSRFLYSSILTDVVADHRPNNEDLGRLVMLKWTLGLSSQEVASCHQRVIADAVSSLGPPVSMDKMLYLSERMFYQEGTTDAGYLDQCARLRNQLGGMSQVDLLRKVTQYAAPYYQVVLEDVISRPENFSGEVLLRTRRRLGISEVVAGGMHLDIYQLAIQRLLDANGKLEEGDRVWLSRLRGIMSVSQFEGERALESVTAPIYREVVQAAFAEVAELHWGQPGVDALRSKLRSRQGDLQLSMAAADAVVKETIRKLALRSLEVALVSLRSGGGESSKAEVLRSMSEVFRLKEAAALLVQKSPNADCSRYFLGVLVGSPSLRLAESEKRTIFRVHLENALKDMRLDEEDKATLAELRGMLQLIEADTRQVYISVVNPLLSARLAGMMEHGDFTAQDVAKLEEDLTVPHEAFLDICMEAYHTKLTKLLERGDITHGSSSMPSDIEKAALDSAAEALGLSREQLYTIHDITCGPAFKAAALELLTVAEAAAVEAFGEQPEPVVIALETLRTRLGMSNDGARAAFVEAFFEVAAPKVKKVSVAIEELKDARKVMPATMGMPTIPLPAGRAGPGASAASALAVAGGPNGGDAGIVARALATSGANPVGASGGEAGSSSAAAAAAAAAAVEGHNGNGLSHVEKLEMRAAEIMEQVLGLASFCERAGASKELEVVLTASGTGRSDPLYSADIGQAVAPRPALMVYTFFLEEGFSPSRASLAVDDPIVKKRESLALVLGLSKAKVIDVHRGGASRLYLDFLQGKLQQKWTLDAVDITSLKAMEEELGMTRVVCDELLARGKKSFVRRRVEEAGARAMDDPSQARRLRQCADNLGVSLRDDLALPEERRRRMFEAEARAMLAEGRDAAAAKSALESICSSLGLHDGAVYDLYAKLRNAPEMQQSNGLEDGTVIVVNASRSPDGHLRSDRGDEGVGSGGAVGGDGEVGNTPSAFVTTPAAYATSE